MSGISPQVRAALNLVRRLPPADIKRNLQGIIELGIAHDPHLEDTLLQDVDQPLATMHDPVAGKDFLKCEFNRDFDSFRSPWTNQYFPAYAGILPSDELRRVEEQLNHVFDSYRDKYFEGGLSSAYCWDQEDGGFSCAVLLKKEGEQTKRRGLLDGRWESIHICDVREHGGRWFYKLTSTVMLSLATPVGDGGQVNLCGCLTRRKEQEMPVNEQNPHVVNLGTLIQNMENHLLTLADEIYFGKASQVISETRKSDIRLTSEGLAHGVHDGIAGSS
eukprot:gnl/Spiro4/14788_TR7971_c0_g1_i1.p1 gnl/Spiro4/14788_TR7971_c0_g1~~gnl/Spiro4/14788_TR7971_c0_g1_i1.p1  ORF type:complete len:293 (+),score=60.77 gnl/Spiro4/14788_TR7971_c0_g1_i1:57-881(+)